MLRREAPKPQTYFAVWRERPDGSHPRKTLVPSFIEKYRVLLQAVAIIPPILALLLGGAPMEFVLSFPALWISLMVCLPTRKTPRSLLDAMDSPATVIQHPVEVRFYTNGVPIGTDIGLISFVNECNFFLGQETTFSLYSTKTRRAGDKLSPYQIRWTADSFWGEIEILPCGPERSKGINYGLSS